MTKKINSSQLSPFSSSVETTLNLEIISSRERVVRAGLLTGSDEQDQMLRDIGAIGVIASSQLREIYIGASQWYNTRRKLERFKKIKRHSIQRDKKNIPVYTLGVTGYRITKQEGINEWVFLKPDQILQKLIFFQLVLRLRKQGMKLEIEPVAEPFVGVIRMNDSFYHVLAIRGNENQIKNFLRYEEVPQKMIIISETLAHAKNIEPEIYPFYESIRLTTDADMMLPLSEMFYKMEEKEWVKEAAAVRRLVHK